MARKFTASKTQLKPDPRFDSKLASKFINCLMHDGKKSVAQKRLLRRAWTSIKKQLPDVEPIEVFTQRRRERQAVIEVRSKRVGGAAYQVPMQVNRNRQQSLAIRWILMAVREKKGRADAPASSPTSWWPPTTAKAPPSAAARTSTAWPTPTRRSPTSPGKSQPDVGSLGKTSIPGSSPSSLALANRPGFVVSRVRPASRVQVTGNWRQTTLPASVLATSRRSVAMHLMRIRWEIWSIHQVTSQ